MCILALADGIPPMRLANRGFRELSKAVLIGSLIPNLAFMLQLGSVNRLLTIFSLPLFLLSLSYFLVLNFPTYADDLKYERRTFLMSLSWERAIPFHNLLIISGYLFLAASPFLGVPIRFIWPAMLTLPLAGYQIYLLRGIADGVKPIWPLLVATATAIFSLTMYLIALSLWLG
jgi:1,4-dihydroxy-2-naphthoate octaprenyltransferase